MRASYVNGSIQHHSVCRVFHTSYLDGVFRQVELCGQLAPLRPRDVVLLDELLLQPPDLLPRKRRAVPPNVVHVVVAAAVLLLLLLGRVGARRCGEAVGRCRG